MTLTSAKAGHVLLVTAAVAAVAAILLTGLVSEAWALICWALGGTVWLLLLCNLRWPMSPALRRRLAYGPNAEYPSAPVERKLKSKWLSISCSVGFLLWLSGASALLAGHKDLGTLSFVTVMVLSTCVTSAIGTGFRLQGASDRSQPRTNLFEAIQRGHT